MGIDRTVQKAIVSMLAASFLLFSSSRLRAQSTFGESATMVGPLNDLRGFQRQATGEWWAANGHIVQRQHKGTAIVLFGERNWDNYRVSARVRLIRGAPEGEAGLLIHFTDMDDYLVFSVKNRKGGPQALLRIVHRKPAMNIYGDESPVADSLDDWHELRAEVHGVDIQGYLDGKPCVSYSFQGTPPPYNAYGKTWDPDLDHGWTGLLAVDAPAEYADFRLQPLAASVQIVTPQRGIWSQQGKLLPRQSYAQTMQRFTDWLMQSDKVINMDKVPVSLRGEEPYLLTNFVTSDNEVLGTGGEFAFNHALLISGAVQYYTFTGERKYLSIAEKTADWEISHSTPANWAWPNMAASFITFKKDGSWQGQDWGLEPDKSAYMGYSYLKLYAADRNEKYLQAARKIAATLEQHQGPERELSFLASMRARGRSSTHTPAASFGTCGSSRNWLKSLATAGT